MYDDKQYVFDVETKKIKKKRVPFHKVVYAIIHNILQLYPELIKKMSFEKTKYLLNEDNFKKFYDQIITELVEYDTRNKIKWKESIYPTAWYRRITNISWQICHNNYSNYSN